MLQVRRTMAAFAAHEIVFQIVVICGDCAQRFDHCGSQRSAAEICVNDDTGAVDHRLNFRELHCFDGRANAAHCAAEVWDFFLCAKQPELAANDVNDNAAGQIAAADFTDDFVDGRNFPQRGPGYFVIHMRGLLERTTLPTIAA